ncbi:hypothetical protein HS088_TW13G00719 [Tripterygium wilfordii]|uniref:Uncharacterized protein n=1 Tax=Tripterygium wilfordii TaxID=458696 RepID=A0A7J7CUZ9_TRIWF|nr:hypothetical protein HS088_TW13G00719 [Tripterygium wilfordii]
MILDIWGEDADEFNQMRFKESRSHVASLFPFGLGPRDCLSQTQDIYEAKIAVTTEHTSSLPRFKSDRGYVTINVIILKYLKDNMSSQSQVKRL